MANITHVNFFCQILIHDQREVPVMKQFGFSASPGTAVIASIAKTVVKY